MTDIIDEYYPGTSAQNYFTINKEVAGEEQIVESYTTGDDNNWASQSSNTLLAQTFTVGTTGANEDFTVSSIKLLLYKMGNPGISTVYLYATDIDGKPTGSALSTGTTNGDTLPTGAPYEWREITMSEYNLQSSTKYAIVLSVPNASVSHRVRWRADSSSPIYAGGSWGESSNGGSSWALDTGVDFLFEVIGRGPEIIETTINVNSTPSDADVYIDENWIGKTPISDYQINPGTYILKLSLAGYQDYTEEFTITEGEIKNFDRTLEPIAETSVNVIVDIERASSTRFDQFLINLQFLESGTENIIYDKKIIIDFNGTNYSGQVQNILSGIYDIRGKIFPCTYRKLNNVMVLPDGSATLDFTIANNKQFYPGDVNQSGTIDAGDFLAVNSMIGQVDE